MEVNIASSEVKRISRQKSLFLGLTIALAGSIVLLTFKIAITDQRVIMVPGINQNMIVSESEVSRGYLEEMSALVFLPGLLDLNAKTINYKRDLILKYTSQSSREYMKAIIEYFADSKERYAKFNLSTHFTPKNMEINAKDLTVKVNGILTSLYGKRGIETSLVSYLISYEWIGGQLRLKEFSQLLSDTELEKLKKQEEEQELETNKLIDNAASNNSGGMQ